MRLGSARAAVAAIIVAIALTACGTQPPAPASPAAPSTTAAASLSSACASANRLADVPGDAAYDLTLTDPGTQAVQVAQVAVIFYGADGTEIGSDDPAQQDFPGDQQPISSFNTVLIGPGQSVTIPMETAKISGAAGNWTCQLGTWSDG